MAEPDAKPRLPWRRARAGGLRILHRPELPPELALRAIERHREHDARGRQACEQWGPASSVSRVHLEGPAGPLDLAVKWSRWRGLRGALSDALLGSRAARALVGAERVRRAGVATAEPLAAAERRRFGVARESFLVTRFLAGAVPLPAALPALAPARRRALARRLGDLLGTLHAAGLAPADLKHSNLLVGPGEEVALVDLDSLVPRRRPSWRRRVRALGQLEAYATDLYPWLPASDRARFLRAYLEHAPALRRRRGRLVRDVRRWVRGRLAAWSRRDRRGHHVYPLAPRGSPARDARFTRPGPPEAPGAAAGGAPDSGGQPPDRSRDPRAGG